MGRVGFPTSRAVTHFLREAAGRASRREGVWGLQKWFPSGRDATAALDDRTLEKFLAAQTLAFDAAKAVGRELREGWTERQAAALLSQHLRDCGVKSFFHDAFAWFGERTGFHGVRSYRDFLPTERRLRGGEAWLLDVAPNVGRYRCDIGLSGALGPTSRFREAMRFLGELRAAIPGIFESAADGGAAVRTVEERIRAAGWGLAHRRYPFQVLGHRIHAGPGVLPQIKIMHFGLESFGGILARGVFGELLNDRYEGSVDGLWAIEPHLASGAATTGAPAFGAKFEELLLVREGKARWLAEKIPWGEP